MVDVILCLLVFFMAATRLYDWDESEFVVNVPEVPRPRRPRPHPTTWCSPSSVAAWCPSANRPTTSTSWSPCSARPGADTQPGRRDPRRRVSWHTRTWLTSSQPATRPASATCGCPFALAIEMQRHPYRQPQKTANTTGLAVAMELLNASSLAACSLDHGSESRQRLMSTRPALGPWLYVVLFADHLRRDGAGRHPIPAGRLAARSRSARSRPIRIADPAGTDRASCLSSPRCWVTPSITRSAPCLGPRVFTREDSWLLNKKHLLRAHDFYEEYGGVTIILARFIPIVRTFAPFVAGIGKMSYRRFAVYNIAGGTCMDLAFLVAGWWFGGQEFVQKNFKLVVVAIIVISVLPGVFEYFRARESDTSRRS